MGDFDHAKPFAAEQAGRLGDAQAMHVLDGRTTEGAVEAAAKMGAGKTAGASQVDQARSLGQGLPQADQSRKQAAGIVETSRKAAGLHGAQQSDEADRDPGLAAMMPPSATLAVFPAGREKGAIDLAIHVDGEGIGNLDDAPEQRSFDPRLVVHGDDLDLGSFDGPGAVHDAAGNVDADSGPEVDAPVGDAHPPAPAADQEGHLVGNDPRGDTPGRSAMPEHGADRLDPQVVEDLAEDRVDGRGWPPGVQDSGRVSHA